MEKHKCKLCFKNFANGRALGGHMRSHVMNFYSPPKSDHHQQQQQTNFGNQFGDSAPSPSSSSSSSEEENEDRELLSYMLRENPKKSVKLASPEFSSGRSMVVIQDRLSETESSKNPTRRRSKRIRKLGNSDHHHHHQNQCVHSGKEPAKKPNLGKLSLWTAPKLGKSSSWVTEQEQPMSSISDTSPEEDVAYCLMMLSRDNWMRDKIEREEEEEGDDGDDQSDTCEFIKPISNNGSKNQRVKGKYKCETCLKVFKSYQALGGHRASHKKAKVNSFHNCSSAPKEPEVELRIEANREEKTHECPLCFRVFASGQALGGHKRSHVIGSQSNTTAAASLAKKSPVKFGESFIDLNLPAPIDNDDDDLSAVSDAEFVKTN